MPRWLPVCGAALALFQLGGMLHLAAAPHGMCWEHGVVVDVDSVPRGAVALAARKGLGAATEPLVRSDQHPHCAALLVLRQGRLEGERAVLVPRDAQHRAVVAAPEQLPAPPGSVLRLAPKQSPPV